MTIGRNLARFFALIAAVVIGLLAIFTVLLTNVDQSFRAISSQTQNEISLINTVRYAGLRIVSSAYELLLIGSLTKAPDSGAESPESGAKEGESDKTEIELIESDIAASEQYYALYLDSVEEDEAPLAAAVGAGIRELIEQARVAIALNEEGASARDVLAFKEKFEDVEQAFLSAIEVALQHETEELNERLGEFHLAVEISQVAVWTGFVALGFVMFLVGRSTAKSIAGRIVALRDSAIALGQNKRGARAVIAGDDEVSDLANTFNAMAAKLEESNAARDTSARRLRDTNESLESTVQERTADLLIAKDLAEAASQAKSEFLSSMSHELRTPLNAIVGFAQLMEMDEAITGNEQHTRAIGHIRAGGDFLLALITQVLDLKRIETGDMEISIGQVNVRDAVGSCLPFIEGGAAKRNIDIINKTREQILSLVYADQTRLQQVFINLLSNALKYNRDGGKIVVDAHVSENGAVRISITDSGLGIPHNQHGNIF